MKGEKYMKKIERAFRNLHRELDEDYQKLSDILHQTRLSHKRKVSLLKKCDALLCAIQNKFDMNLEDKAYIKEFRGQIDRELCLNGRVNYFINKKN